MKKDVVFLIGMRGSGKSTVGKELARSMGYGFADTDVALQEHLGKTIAEVVEGEGWEAFRRHESEVLQWVTKPRTVVATGGGCILLEQNRVFMRERGIVVYLDVPLGILAQRLTSGEEDPSRPSLTGSDIVDELGAVFQQRGEIYCELSHITTDGAKNINLIVESIVAKLSAIL